MANKEYQGWKNWQTWNIALYLNNEEPAYRAMQDCVRDARRAAKREGKRYRGVKADRACEFVRTLFPHGTPDMRDRDNPTGRRGAAAMDGAHWPSIAHVISLSLEAGQP